MILSFTVEIRHFSNLFGSHLSGSSSVNQGMGVLKAPSIVQYSMMTFGRSVIMSVAVMTVFDFRQYCKNLKMAPKSRGFILLATGLGL